MYQALKIWLERETKILMSEVDNKLNKAMI